jgi:hypothetical protein
MVTVPVGSWSSIAVAVEVVGVEGVAELVPDALGVGDAVCLLEHAHRLALARTRIVRTATLRMFVPSPATANRATTNRRTLTFVPFLHSRTPKRVIPLQPPSYNHTGS